MTKATIAKLAVIIFLAFIVCLPEFFPSEVLQIQFLCTPFDPCDSNSPHGRYDRQVCEMYESAAMTRPRCVAKNTTSQDEAIMKWFVCKTQTDLRSLRDNASISEMGTGVIVTLQIIAPPLLQNLTVNGHFNHSGLHIEIQHNITQFVCCVQNGSTRQNRDETPLSSSSKHNSEPHKPNTSEAGIFLAGSFDVTSSEGKNSGSNQNRRSLCLFHVENIWTMSSKKGENDDEYVHVMFSDSLEIFKGLRILHVEKTFSWLSQTI